MANPLNGEAGFAHDGADLVVRFDVAALIEVEDRTGIGLLAMQAAMTKLRFVGTLLQVGLARGCGHEVSLEGAVAMLATNPAAHAAVLTALDRAFPDSGEDAGESGETGANPPKAAGTRAGAGKTS